MGLIKSKQPIDDVFTRPEESSLIDPKRIVFLSLEGENTEVHYFNHLDSCLMPNDVILKVEVLERADGSKSAPRHVYELLVEYERIRDGELSDELNLTQALSRHSPEAIEELIQKSPADKLDDAEILICKDLQVEAIELQYRKFLKRISHGDRDIVAMVVDSDFTNQAKRRDELIKYNTYCSDKSFGFYITNPCFEFWLLLHLSDVANEYKYRLVEIAENKRTGKSSTSHRFVAKEVSNKAGHGKSICEEIFKTFYLPRIDVAMTRAESFSTTWPEILDNIGTNLLDLFRKLGLKNE